MHGRARLPEGGQPRCGSARQAPDLRAQAGEHHRPKSLERPSRTLERPLGESMTAVRARAFCRVWEGLWVEGSCEVGRCSINCSQTVVGPDCRVDLRSHPYTNIMNPLPRIRSPPNISIGTPPIPAVVRHSKEDLGSDPCPRQIIAALSGDLVCGPFRRLLRAGSTDIGLKRWVRPGGDSKAWLGRVERCDHWWGRCVCSRPLARDFVAPHDPERASAADMGMPAFRHVPRSTSAPQLAFQGSRSPYRRAPLHQYLPVSPVGTMSGLCLGIAPYGQITRRPLVAMDLGVGRRGRQRSGVRHEGLELRRPSAKAPSSIISEQPGALAHRWVQHHLAPDFDAVARVHMVLKVGASMQ
jgi:hypothetical protein